MEFWIFLLSVGLFVEWMLRRSFQEKSDERFHNVISTLNRAERDFQEMKRLAARLTELEKQVAVHRATTQPAAAGTPPETKAPEPVKQPAKEAAGEPAKDKAPETPALHVPPHLPPSAVAIPPAPKLPQPVPVTPRPVSTPRPASAPTFTSPATTARSSTPQEARKRAYDIEQVLGANWLNKIGIAVLVIGIALFLAYKFPTLTNAEKIGLGYFVSLAILGLGVFLEKKDLYRIFARALIGGGWALVFFTTYAMHFVKHTQVIETQWVDLVLLFAVAWAMVWHTLHYNSQIVTGLAFLLAFTTVAISQSTVYCLTAGAILAVGLVAIVHKRAWFELEVFGRLASYLNHYIWLRTVIEPMGAQRHMFPEFLPSAGLLCAYWAIYRWSYIARTIQSAAQEHVSALAALLNTCGLLVLMKYQSVRPELAFYALLVLGAVELTLGQLPVTRKRRMAMVMLSTIGAVLLVAAIPFKYSGMSMAVLWLSQAQVLLLAGVLTREVLFRRFGLVAALLTMCDMLVTGATPVLQTRLDAADLLHSTPEYRLAVTFLFGALLFYADAHWIPKRWKDLDQSEAEVICFRGLSYLAGFSLLIALWLAFPNSWTAVAWAALGALVAMIGGVTGEADISYQANGPALAAFFCALAVNLHATQEWHGFTLRLITLTLIAGLLYLCAYFAGPQGTQTAAVLSGLHTWAGTILLALLAYDEFSSAWIAVAWSALALVLLWAGNRLKRVDISIQAFVLSAISVVQVLLVNIGATEPFAPMPRISLRLATVGIVVAIFYLSAWVGRSADENAEIISAAYTCGGSALAGALIYLEAAPANVALGWVLLGLALFECGVLLKRLPLRVQAYVAFAFTMVRVFTFNVDTPRREMLLTTLPLAIVFYYVYGRLQAAEKHELSADLQLLAGPALSYFGTATIATVIFCGFEWGWISAGWAGFALLLIATAWATRQNVFLHQCLMLSCAVLFRTFVFELPPDRITPALWNDSRWAQVGASSLLLLACLAFAFPLRRRFAEVGTRRAEGWTAIVERPEQMLFFVPLLQITALLAREVAAGRVTMAWGVEAVIVFLFALIVGERSYRLTGLGLLLLCVGKILVLDVWEQNKSDRFVTFIILGTSLLLVSFLYTRYSEAIRRYL